MTIRIFSTLLKSRNPIEHGFNLEDQEGELRQVVGDGWNLIEFPQKQIIDKGRKVNLQWYVHESDFFLKQ